MDTDQGTTTAAGWVADDSTFGARLALIRQRMGWGNIARAAKEVGVPVDSWRNWETDGRLPHRLTTIAMAIATKAGCDYLWLVHGPDRGSVRPVRIDDPARPTGRYLGEHVVAVVGTRNGRPDRTGIPTRPVRQTRPIARSSRRPLTPVAV